MPSKSHNVEQAATTLQVPFNPKRFPPSSTFALTPLTPFDALAALEVNNSLICGTAPDFSRSPLLPALLFPHSTRSNPNAP